MTDSTKPKSRKAAEKPVEKLEPITLEQAEASIAAAEDSIVSHGDSYENAFSKHYDEAYFAVYANVGLAYKEPWLQFFGEIAHRLVALFRPASVIDVGAAVGILVEAFRNRKIAARGFDVSKWAANQSPSLSVYIDDLALDWSLRDAPANKHDLVVCIEVLEHIEESRAAIAIRNLCSLVAEGGTIVFSSAAADVIGTDDVFHINARDEAYWLALFAENGFSKTADDVRFICPWAIALRK